MGSYVNPDNGQFLKDVNSKIYVDKSGMIRFLNSAVNTNQNDICVSRPRRFGKTMAANMICAYYSRTAGLRDVFERMDIAAQAAKGDLTWDEYLGEFDVIRISMTDFIKRDRTVSDSMKTLTARVLKDLGKMNPEVDFDPEDLGYSMDQYYQASHISFVIVIDEWDCIFRIRKDDREGQVLYLDFLRSWLKDRGFIALAYMTGILPIKKYGEHSALNMFTEFSMVSPKKLAPFTGFTSMEVQQICRDRNLNYLALKDWYDGYRLSDRPSEELTGKETGSAYHVFEIYSPLSVVNAVTYKQLGNYWNATETYEALAEYIRLNFDGLKDTIALLMDGGRVKTDLSGYQNDMTTFHKKDDVLALLIHLGYLGYDSDSEEVFIPNREILDVFRTSTESDEWTNTFESFELSKELLRATWACDEKKVADLVEHAHDKASNQSYNSEAALSYGIQYAYYAAQKYYTTILELDSGKGYADIAYLPSPRYPDKPAMVIELKYNQDTDTALNQIIQKNYPDRLGHYRGNILLVSINYSRDADSHSRDYKHHSCSIRKA